MAGSDFNNQNDEVEIGELRRSSSGGTFSRGDDSEEIDREDFTIGPIGHQQQEETSAPKIQSAFSNRLPLLQTYSNQIDSILQSKSSGSSFERNFNILLD